MPATTLTHLIEFLLLLGSFVNPMQDHRKMVPVTDKARALVLFAEKGEPGEYSKVLAAIRAQKERADVRLQKNRKSVAAIEADIRKDMDILKGAGAQAALIAKRIEIKKDSVKVRQRVQPALQKMIDDRVKEEQAFTKVYQLIEKERQRGDKQPTLLTQFLQRLATILGPYDHSLYPLPIAAADKAKALLLLAKKGDSSEHKKMLAAIRKKQKETESLIAKNRGFIKDLEDSLRDDKALLAKATGDTSGIEKRMAGTKRSLQMYSDIVVKARQHLQARVKEEQAWGEVLRLIGKAKKP